MTPDKDLSKRIDDYLNHLLDESEKQAFEKEMSVDAVLRDRVELTRIANKVVLKNKLWEIKELTRQRIEEGKTSKANRNKGLAGLAALVLLGTGIAYFALSSKESPVDIHKTASTNSATPVVSTPNASETVTSLKTEFTPRPEAPAAYPPAQKENTTEVMVSASPKPEAKVSLEESGTKPMAESTPVVEEKKLGSATPLSQPDKKQEDNVSAAVDKCATTKISAILHATGTCPGQSSGAIMVSNFTGGTKPYKVKVLDDQQKEHSALQLPAGTFSVEITDSRGCTSTHKGIIVKEEGCQQDFEINPDNGDVWELGHSAQPAVLSVYDQNENLYFYRKFEKGEAIKWNGASSKGETLAGYFLFVLKYQDGKTASGSITIVR